MLWTSSPCKANRLGEILQSGSARWLTNMRYINIVHVKRLTPTGHGLAMRVLLPSLQRALLR